MNQERLASLIHAQTATIVELEDHLSTHETIRRILRVLALGEITANQAIDILTETAERSANPSCAQLYQQAIAHLRQLQAEENH